MLLNLLGMSIVLVPSNESASKMLFIPDIVKLISLSPLQLLLEIETEKQMIINQRKWIACSGIRSQNL